MLIREKKKDLKRIVETERKRKIKIVVISQIPFVMNCTFNPNTNTLLKSKLDFTRDVTERLSGQWDYASKSLPLYIG